MLSSKTTYILGLLILLLAANACMLMRYTNYPVGSYREGFANYILGSAPAAGTSMGIYDNVIKAGMTQGQWKVNTTNEAKLGPKFEPGPDSLFMFKNNQCKPECCGASFSCSGGCVCTTEADRNAILTRGGNRTTPGDF
jgi:hypothetical protein